MDTWHLPESPQHVLSLSYLDISMFHGVKGAPDTVPYLHLNVYVYKFEQANRERKNIPGSMYQKYRNMVLCKPSKELTLGSTSWLTETQYLNPQMRLKPSEGIRDTELRVTESLVSINHFCVSCQYPIPWTCEQKEHQRGTEQFTASLCCPGQAGRLQKLGS